MSAPIIVETIGDLRRALQTAANDLPLQFLFDGADYRKLKVQICYQSEPEAFVKMEPVDD